MTPKDGDWHTFFVCSIQDIYVLIRLVGYIHRGPEANGMSIILDGRKIKVTSVVQAESKSTNNYVMFSGPKKFFADRMVRTEIEFFPDVDNKPNKSITLTRSEYTRLKLMIEPFRDVCPKCGLIPYLDEKK